MSKDRSERNGNNGRVWYDSTSAFIKIIDNKLTTWVLWHEKDNYPFSRAVSLGFEANSVPGLFQPGTVPDDLGRR